MGEEERYQRAYRRVQAIRGFYIHLIVYILVNIGLFVLNLLVSPGSLWFYWPLLGWGIALLAHGLVVFSSWRLFGKEWEAREIRKILEKEE